MAVCRQTKPAADGRVLVWDAAVRLLHWLLAALVLFDLVQDDGGWLHRTVGYAAVVAVCIRFLWAMARRRAILADLKPSMAKTVAYLRGGAPRTLGHDPLGLWMVWFLWLVVALLGLTGWMSRLDAFWGDESVHAVHAWLADAMLVAVMLHLAGVAAMSWWWRENLPGAMFTGRKKVEISPRDES